MDAPALTDEEYEKIVFQMREGIEKPKPKVKFGEGESVRIIDGPFSSFNGVVDEVNVDKGKVKVLVSIFGRQTPWNSISFRWRRINTGGTPSARSREWRKKSLPR